MLEEPDTDTEHVVCQAMPDGDLHDTLFGDSVKFIEGISRDEPDVDLLLKKMDREIFADFKKNCDSGLLKDLLVVTFQKY